MRSASAIGLLAVLALAGCTTTQQRNERAKLAATRLIESRKPLRLGAADPAVRVGKVALVHHDGAAAIVVELRNTGDAPVTDLPIEVGFRGGRVLNRRGGWFSNHVAAVAPGATTRWVYVLARRLRRLGTPYARVGAPVLSHAGRLPRLVAAALRDAARPRGRTAPTLRARVRNASQIPQVGLQVYALALRGTRYTAAGRGSVAHLGSGEAKELKLRLIGTTGGARIELVAQPTIFE